MYDPVNKTYSTAQHRLANFFETQTRFWKFGTWPDWAQDSMLEGNKNDYTLRFNLFYFLTKNNLFGPIAKKWVLANDVYTADDQEPELQFPEYPGHVWHDMTRLEKQAKDGSLFINDKPMMNMYENQVTRQGNLSHYAPYERWITRRAGRPEGDEDVHPGAALDSQASEGEGKGDISRPTPRSRRQPHPAVQAWRANRQGIVYPANPVQQPIRRATSTLRFVRTSKEGRGKGFYVTSYLGRDYRLY